MASISTCFIFTCTKPKPHKTLNVKPYKTLSFSQNKTTLPHKPLKISCKARNNGNIVWPTEIRPGGVVETDKLSKDVRERTVEAVLLCGRRVTVGDVASKAGLKINEAQKALQALDADTAGFLEVSDDGDVLYVFEKDYRSKLAGKSFRLKVEFYVEKAKLAGELLVGVSFGTALIASIVIVFIAIIAILSSSRDSEDDNCRRRRSRSFNSSRSLFCHWDPYYDRRWQMRGESGGTNFLISVFSFVFGEGDPNEGLEEKRWMLIGEYITTNGGVVTAEELAPYLDLETTDKLGYDSYILPVLLRFDGQPEVDEEGNILYRFPSLQRTAALLGRNRKDFFGKKRADFVGRVENYLKEKKWEFSKASMPERTLVVGLGALNLSGVITLGAMLNGNTTQLPPGFLTFVANIFPLLQQKNNEIEKRNLAREIRAQALKSPDPSLRRKISSARDFSQRISIGQDRIVYSTKNDMFEKEYETNEWDRRFREIEKSE